MTGGADMGGGPGLSLVGDGGPPESLRNSAANSCTSLDFFPTLPKGLVGGARGVAEASTSPSVFSLFRELDRWGVPWPWAFRGTVTCWVGGRWPCTEAGRSVPLRRSILALRAE